MQEHTSEIIVRYAETDRMGVVYYGNYFTWLEVARTEYFRSLGIRYEKLEEKEGLRLMVVEAKCCYKSPVTYEDKVYIETRVEGLKNTSFVFKYRLTKNSKLVATAETIHVFTDRSGRPVRIPEKIKEKISGLS